MSPERRQQIEKRLYDYPAIKRRYRVLTRQESRMLESIEESLPSDTVASPVLTGMPHGTEVSNPTIRLVVQREVLWERIIAETNELMREQLEEIALLTDEIVLMESVLTELDAVQRALIDWRYWQSEAESHPPSYEWLADKFRYEETRSLQGFLVPCDRRRVSAALQRVLRAFDKAWFGSREICTTFAQDFTKNGTDRAKKEVYNRSIESSG